MSSLILLLFAVDPLGLHFESAEKVDLTYEGFTVTLVNPDTIKKLAPLMAVKGEVKKENAVPGVSHLIWITIGKKRFWLTRGLIGSEEGHIATADEKLRDALLVYFQEDWEKTIAAAMNGCDELELRWRGGLTHMPLGEAGKEMCLKFLKPAGEVEYGKLPENPYEIVFVNKETRMSLFIVGDTAYWGGNRSVKLAKDSMWKMLVKSVKPIGRERGTNWLL